MNFSAARGTFPTEISIHSDRLSIQIYGQKTDWIFFLLKPIKSFQQGTLCGQINFLAKIGCAINDSFKIGE